MINRIVKKILSYFNLRLVNLRNERNTDIDLYYKIYLRDSIVNKRFYNIGAGKFRHPFWTNVDYSSDWYNELQQNSDFINFNLFSLEKLPIDDNTAEVVYSSHTIEHINDEAAQNFFIEAFRILKNNGVLRITTPNIDLFHRSYLKKDFNFFYWIDTYSKPENYKRIKIKIPLNKASIQQIFLFQFASCLSELLIDETLSKISDIEIDETFSKLNYEEALNYFTSKCSVESQMKNPGFHMNWWNEEKAFRMLKKAGFKKIYRSGYGQSFCPVLRNTNFFDKTHLKISLYIEAIKT